MTPTTVAQWEQLMELASYARHEIEVANPDGDFAAHIGVDDRPLTEFCTREAEISMRGLLGLGGHVGVTTTSEVCALVATHLHIGVLCGIWLAQNGHIEAPAVAAGSFQRPDGEA